MGGRGRYASCFFSTIHSKLLFSEGLTGKIAELGILDVLEGHQVLQARPFAAMLVAKVVNHAEGQLGNVDDTNVAAGERKTDRDQIRIGKI